MGAVIRAALLVAVAACSRPAPPVAAPAVATDAAPERAAGCRADLAPVRAEAGVVVTAHPEATRIGAEVLAQGGSAADAAVAVSVALTLVEPQSSGIGGGGFLLHYEAGSGVISAWDGREAAPAGAGADLFRVDGAVLPWPDAVPTGLSVGVPGLVRMLEGVHAAHGRLPWADLLLPTAALADAGFDVTERLTASIAYMDASPIDALRKDPSANALFHVDGQPLPPGFRLRNPALADTVRALAADPDALYEGPLAEAIVAAVAGAARPGRLTTDDLRGYRAARREAVCVATRGRRVCGHPPPTSGGVTTLQILAITEHADQPALHERIEAERLAWADRERYLADPAAVPVPTAALLAPEYLSARAAAIGTRRGPEPAAGVVDLPAPPIGELCAPPEHTTHFVIADRDGNVVSATNSIENAFGAGILVGGFLLNNELTDFAMNPDAADGSRRANAPGPCKRPRSSMAPLLILDDAGVELAIGSPGGSRIISYVAQAVIDVVDRGLPLQEALAQPHAVARGDVVEVEAGCGDPAVADAMAAELEAAGHAVRRAELNSGLHAIQRAAGGGWWGAVDPRRDGEARAVP